MRRRSTAGGKSPNAQAPKAAARKSRVAPEAVHPRSTSTGNLETEVAQLARERDEALEQQAATSGVLNAISRSTFDLPTVLSTLVETAARLCRADKVQILLPSENTNRVYSAASFGYSAEANEYLKTTAFAPGREGVVGRVLLERKPVQIADVLADPEYRLREIQRLGGFRTHLGLPLFRQDSVIGVLLVSRSIVEPFADKHIELLSTFAAQAVIAIENARLLNELRQRTDDLGQRTVDLTEALEQQTATSEVLKVISSSPADLQSVFDTMLANATRLCEATHGHVWTFDGEQMHAVAVRGDAPFVKGLQGHNPVRPIPGSAAERIVRGERFVHVTDRRQEPAYRDNQTFRGLVDTSGIRASLSVALRKGDTLLGMINVYRQDVRPFTDNQIKLVEDFASQAVIAIENTRLLTELRQSLEQQTTTAEVLGVISSSKFELQPILQTVVDTAARLCRAESAVIFRQDKGIYRFAAGYSLNPTYLEVERQNQILPGHGTLVGRAALTGQVVRIDDAWTDPLYERKQDAEVGIVRSMIGVPLMRNGEPIGVVGLARGHVEPFSDREIELVTTFADQAAIAIENVRLFEAEQQRTRELSESLEQQTATSQVLQQVISSSPGELEPVFQTMLANATRLCEASYGAMWLREGDRFRNAAFQGDLPVAYKELWRNATVGHTAPMGRVAQSRQPMQIADLREDQTYVDRHPLTVTAVEVAGILTLALVPMLKENEVVGAISMYRKEVRPFSDKQIELVQNFANQAVIAIENTRLLNELRHSLQQQTAIADVLKVISRSAFDLRTVLQALVESAARFCNADKAIIVRERDGVFYTAEAYGYPREFLDYIKNIPIKAERGSASGRALLEGRVVHITDAAADPEYTLVEARRLGDYRTILCVPMLREGVPIGLLILTRSEVQAFTDKQIELVTTFADQAAIAIENVRLFEAEQQRTRELAKSLEDLRTTQDCLVQTQKLASLGQLTAGIAHEIKNPLNFVNNFSGVSAELIDELQENLGKVKADANTSTEITELTNTLRDNLDKIVQHGRRADAIVKNMLLHSREGSGEHRLVDANALVEESLNLAYHGARAEHQGFKINIEKSFDPTAGQVDVYPQEITRALLNLISNGFYAATKRIEHDDSDGYEPTLAASTRSLGDRVVITIRDNGTGISPEVREKMFNPFFTTKAAGEGTGLGLSITHDIIVKQHSGSIEVDTKPGEFTEIRIILPRTATLITDSQGPA
jgi:GAF domain-containing protein